jgi:hypothetical protein
MEPVEEISWFIPTLHDADWSKWVLGVHQVILKQTNVKE